MIILAIETSSPRGSLALATSGVAGPLRLARRDFETGRGHGGGFFVALREILAVLEPGQRLSGIVVGLGPGSYSGVRQAVAAAHGLALAHGAMLRSRPSPEAMPVDAPAWHAVGDARRDRFYFVTVRAGRCEQPPELLDRDGVQARLAAAAPDLPLVAAEPSAALEIFPGVRLLPPDAARLLAGWETLPDTPLEPIYLRPPNITAPKPR